MKNLLIASLLSISCVAVADKAPPPKPVPLFAEQVLPEGAGNDWDTFTLTLLPDGVVERVDHKKGVETHATGRLDAKQVAAIKAELATPHWTVIHQDIHCMAIGVTFVRFSVNGKAVYDQHVCGDPLDADSAKAIHDVGAIVEAAVPTSTPPTPPGPPTGAAPAPVTCSKSGGPLYEEELEPEGRNASPIATFKITVYEGGTWERVDRDTAGKTQGEASGCLDAAQLKTVRDALANQRWQVTPSPVACDALSATFTVERVRGKTVFEERICNSKRLDANSAKAIETVRVLVEKVSAPHVMPCCKK